MAEKPAPRSLRWLIFIPPVIFGLLVGLFAAGMFRPDPEGLPSTMVGRPAPAVEVAAMDGATLTDDAALRGGEVTLLNFWASWCPPCRAEHPFLEELAADGIAIHGINYKDDPARAAEFLDELGNPFATMGADRVGRMAINWGVYGMPETYVIAGDGTVILRHAGPITRQEIERRIAPAIEAARAR